ncbi:ubiquitin-conjugating enzyme E2 U [Protopterus annectens]|uniref:ubiquitin-conjugating enzyme E2 U n=1 Tax=Protopterus annectens TaxID=7888 RepID=UPI001CF946FF|nr:ubiquitin-conjugating enzyme E2 U [Protopterus annectens]
MQSRAYLLLQKEHTQLSNANLYGITISPVTDNLMEWIARVQGLKDSLWEGGVFQLSFRYTEEYNSVPPIINFNTIPFHPNVNKTSGRPCIEFLDNPEKWNATISMRVILLTLQVMLSNPVIENAVNLEALEMMMKNPSQYRQMVLKCVKASQQLECASDTIKEFSSFSSPLSSPILHSLDVNVKSISFEDYCKTWSGIATSKTLKEFNNPLLQELLGYPSLQTAHCGLEEKWLKDEIAEQNKEFSCMMYGAFGQPKKAQMKIDEKLIRLNQMKSIYLQRRTPELVTPLPTHRPEMHLKSTRPEGEPWETEVDNLVAWTHSLNADELEED